MAFLRFRQQGECLISRTMNICPAMYAGIMFARNLLECFALCVAPIVKLFNHVVNAASYTDEPFAN
jgi:hypothetical protein